MNTKKAFGSLESKSNKHDDHDHLTYLKVQHKVSVCQD